MITVFKGDINELAVDATFSVSPTPLGEAATLTGLLKSTYIIHQAAMEQVPADKNKLKLITRSVFQRAEEHNLHNIALAPLGAGVKAADLETAVNVIISETRRHLACNSRLDKVAFLVFDDTAFEAFSEVARRELVACLGDSITYGYPYGPEASWVALSSAEVGLKLVNMGINGDSTFDMLGRFKSDVLPAVPAFVIIQGGANDILLGMSMEKIKDNITVMVAKAFEAGICPVLGMPPPALTGGGFVPAGLAGQLAEAMKQISRWISVFAEQEKLPMLDFYTPLLDPQIGEGNPYFFVDGAHPNRNGYRELARAAGQVLLRLKKGLYYSV